MMYAQVTADTINAVGRLPNSARRLDTRQWVMGLTNAPTELVEACGWYSVTDTPPDHDPATQVVERGDVTLVDGRPVRRYTVRAKTADELAAEAEAAQDQTERDQARAAFDTLGNYINLSSPTSAQTVATVKLLARVCRRLIRDQYGR